MNVDNVEHVVAEAIRTSRLENRTATIAAETQQAFEELTDELVAACEGYDPAGGFAPLGALDYCGTDWVVCLLPPA